MLQVQVVSVLPSNKGATTTVLAQYFASTQLLRFEFLSRNMQTLIQMLRARHPTRATRKLTVTKDRVKKDHLRGAFGVGSPTVQAVQRV